MEYRQLGRSGAMVSALGLGGNTFGRACDAAMTAAIVDRALSIGINHFDTADMYGGTRSEEYLGAALRGRRSDAIIATKTGYPLGEGPNDEGLSRRRIIASCEASLRRLQTDYVDVYYLHLPDPRTDIEESLQALDDLVRQGKVRYAACSNYTGWEIARLCERAMAHGWAVPVLTQSHYNMFSRETGRDIAPAAAAYGMGIVPYSPLAGGLLTGKYRSVSDAQPGTRAWNNPRFETLLGTDVLDVVAALREFAARYDRTVGDLAVAWLLNQPAVSSVITGVTSPEQVETNARAVGWMFDETELADLAGILAGVPEGLDR
ncbi:MAG TPA: aldo/keto reductase [Chloroflexi bacterium]|nr:aldo/keto reductase [Chloroflexota bacterium]HBY47647.1 aldo/keto reductase [Chloroflexota bacterium]